jgi:hypothetical protein
MSLTILLDAGPLGMITNPKSSPENEACNGWLASVRSLSNAAVVVERESHYNFARNSRKDL